jgi:intraflagellar transport protein 52
LGASRAKVSSATSENSTAKNKKTDGNAANEKLPFVYPYGATLGIQRPGRPILSSGPISYPMNRPIAAIWESETVVGAGAQRGRLVVFGSVDIFGDEWLDKEENSKLCDIMFSWLLGEADLDMTSDRQDSEINEFTPVPHLESISQSIKPCLQGIITSFT